MERVGVDVSVVLILAETIEPLPEVRVMEEKWESEMERLAVVEAMIREEVMMMVEDWEGRRRTEERERDPETAVKREEDIDDSPAVRRRRSSMRETLRDPPEMTKVVVDPMIEEQYFCVFSVSESARISTWLEEIVVV